MGWVVGGSNLSGSVIFCTHPDRLWGPYSMGTGFLPGVKPLRRGPDRTNMPQVLPLGGNLLKGWPLT
jgi:hypothetical protein